MDKCTGSGAADFTNEDKTLLWEKYKELKHITQAERKTAAADKSVCE